MLINEEHSNIKISYQFQTLPVLLAIDAIDMLFQLIFFFVLGYKMHAGDIRPGYERHVSRGIKTSC